MCLYPVPRLVIVNHEIIFDVDNTLKLGLDLTKRRIPDLKNETL